MRVNSQCKIFHTGNISDIADKNLDNDDFFYNLVDIVKQFVPDGESDDSRCNTPVTSPLPDEAEAHLDAHQRDSSGEHHLSADKSSKLNSDVSGGENMETDDKNI